MGALPLSDQSLEASMEKKHNQQEHGAVLDEVKGLVRLYKDGHVERYPVVPHVTCRSNPDLSVSSGDVVIDSCHRVWARFYVPKRQTKLPLLIYFHGGGFCVGSAAWKCYHEFLLRLAGAAGCVVMSVNYRLAPENRLPAAFDDGVAAVKWVRQNAIALCSGEHSWWGAMCDFSKVFIAGDSAGGCLALNVMLQLTSINEANLSGALSPVCIKGLVLIQPFFGGEARTWSEKNMAQPPNSALTLSAADAYWRLSLPAGATRDHPWCNPLSTTTKAAVKGVGNLCLPPVLVCISELDILKDRNMEFCSAMKRAGKKVEHVVHVGVGHAFQILHNSPPAQSRTKEMISHISSFINRV